MANQVAHSRSGSNRGGGTITDLLAKPKVYHPDYRENRRSVYWVDFSPPKCGPDGHTIVTASKRVCSLAEPKPLHRAYMPDRTVIWECDKKKFSKYQPTKRIENLSNAKSLHPNFLFDRPVMTQLTPSIFNHRPSLRLEQLAVAKSRPTSQDQLVDDSAWGTTFSVSSAARRAQSSDRVNQLSEPKKLPSTYELPKEVPWQVTAEARKSIATNRVQHLSRPRSRTMTKDDYDPYKISHAAKHNPGTNRLEELSVPPGRRQKKKVGGV